MTLLLTPLFGGAGLVLGLAHFRGLFWDTSAYLGRGVGLGLVARHAARVLATALVLVAIARGAGGMPLAAALAGFVAARSVAVARRWSPS